ncbi:MAG: hypothetical protein LBU60_00460 [Clostridiales bacterium]|jgi:hypothetical protein|nr:hypothetical protein [Clostridiales bacterium]
MLYNLLFAPTFNKDFSHLQGPPVDANWTKFKNGVYGYIIQHHNTKNGDKNFFFISNTKEFLAFGIYASIFDYAKKGVVDKRYAMRRRGGDHSTMEAGEGDYPTEAAIGMYWDKKSGSLIADNTFLDITAKSLLKNFESEIAPFWDRPRSAATTREHIVQLAKPQQSQSPHLNIKNCRKFLQDIKSDRKDLLKISEYDEETLFYALVHAVLHGEMDKEFNFSTDFNSKAFFKGQSSINIGTIRKSGFLWFSNSKPKYKNQSKEQSDSNVIEPDVAHV